MTVNNICPYSGLPYTCNICPEVSSPCDYMTNISSMSRIMFLDLKRVWVCNDNDFFSLPRVIDYGVKNI